ncbi:MAG: IS1 family transposase [Cardiobacterium sp.]|nr:MAG: IS1 family transposase [Cardiobacterium sp.]
MWVVQTQITVYCPRCRGQNIKRNGKSCNNKQKYLCKDCGRQFVGDHASTIRAAIPMQTG